MAAVAGRAAAGALPASVLEGLAAALERGALVPAASAMQIERVAGSPHAGAAAAMLAALSVEGMTARQAAATLHLLAEARRAAEAKPRPVLVWSDLDVRGSRDTVVVARELFRTAARSVLVSTLSIGHRAKDGEPPGHPLLRPLAERMAAEPGLHARLFLNLTRKEWQRGAPAAQVAVEFGRWFRRDLWPWERLPEVYYDPRSLDEVGEPAFLHAKCIVIDDERALVTSANLTETAHVRNIEAGVLLEDPVFAKELRLSFEALISRGLVHRVRFD